MQLPPRTPGGSACQPLPGRLPPAPPGSVSPPRRLQVPAWAPSPPDAPDAAARGDQNARSSCSLSRSRRQVEVPFRAGRGEEEGSRVQASRLVNHQGPEMPPSVCSPGSLSPSPAAALPPLTHEPITRVLRNGPRSAEMSPCTLVTWMCASPQRPRPAPRVWEPPRPDAQPWRSRAAPSPAPPARPPSRSQQMQLTCLEALLPRGPYAPGLTCCPWGDNPMTRQLCGLCPPSPLTSPPAPQRRSILPASVVTW